MEWWMLQVWFFLLSGPLMLVVNVVLGCGTSADKRVQRCLAAHVAAHA
jgi:hypothetical protein